MKHLAVEILIKLMSYPVGKIEKHVIYIERINNENLSEKDIIDYVDQIRPFALNDEDNLPIWTWNINKKYDVDIIPENHNLNYSNYICDVKIPLSRIPSIYKEKQQSKLRKKEFDVNDYSIKELNNIKIDVTVELFRLENKMTHEELDLWVEEFNKSKFFKPVLSEFLTKIRNKGNETEKHINEVLSISSNEEKVLNKIKYIKILDKKIALNLFSEYWKFLLRAKSNYIGFDIFDHKRAELHQKIFGAINLHRTIDRDSLYGREILRICCLIDPYYYEKLSYDLILENIICDLSKENLLINE